MATRREFVKASTAALCVAGMSRLAAAATLKLPVGLQLYSVREMLPKDYAGTLKQIGSLGYKDVEAAGFYEHSPAEVKKAMSDAGLQLVSSHHNNAELHKNFDSILAFHKELGTQYVICSSTGPKNPTPPGEKTPEMTIDDWRWASDEFNKFGEKFSAAGIKFGYHNHVHEFDKIEGGVPFYEMLQRTDPKYVNFELDCGWAKVAGADPVEILRKHPTRIILLHVKDFVKPATASTNPHDFKNTELGRGFIDYGPIFSEAAKAGHVKHIFVEQEGFDVPPMESLKIDADYIHKLEL